MSISCTRKIEFSLYFFIYFVIFDSEYHLEVYAATEDQLDTIFLRLYRPDGRKLKDAHVDDAGELVDDLDFTKETVLYIHGYTESIESESLKTIVGAYATRSDHNIIAVDWSVLAIRNYIEVATSVADVGKYVATAIRNMLDAGMPFDTFYIVAHSMGCHVAGEVGRNLDPITRIVGLDPAGPLFDLIVIRHPLGPTDAQVVQIIHTDAGFYGMRNIAGTVDFWPNNGVRVQPGCPTLSMPLSNEDFCSHHRSWIYYAESLINESAFSAVRCPLERRRREAPIVMGYATPLDTQGSFHLKTASTSPYGLGLAGEICPPPNKPKLPFPWVSKDA